MTSDLLAKYSSEIKGKTIRKGERGETEEGKEGERRKTKETRRCMKIKDRKKMS